MRVFIQKNNENKKYIMIIKQYWDLDILYLKIGKKLNFQVTDIFLKLNDFEKVIILTLYSNSFLVNYRRYFGNTRW